MDDAELLATLPQILASAEQNTAFAHEWVDLLREPQHLVGRDRPRARRLAPGGLGAVSRGKAGDKCATA